jgi:enoyl-CoA hydratase/carnithine racemase
MPLIHTDLARHVMTITLIDEERRNALSRQLLIELLDAIDVVDNDPDVRVAVVTNSGHVFCAGADLAERTSAPTTDGRTVEISEVFQRIQHSPKPFVGLINGHGDIWLHGSSHRRRPRHDLGRVPTKDASGRR